MKIIDAHVHFSSIQTFVETAHKLADVEYNEGGLLAEYEQLGVVAAVGMGLEESRVGAFPDEEAPALMGLNLKNRPSQIGVCIGINPFALTASELERLDAKLEDPTVVGVKIYLGYYPYYAYDSIYTLVYELAEKHDVPVVFHTGDTYSADALIKYAHPLTIDEVAVKHRNVRFVMAHLGDPWCLTAAEVMYKNHNVFADLSGLIVGTRNRVEPHMDTSNPYFDHFRHALVFGDSYDRYMFGTDWPLVQVRPYMEWLAGIIPERYHEKFFYETALRVFPKLEGLMK
ncbi:amidohydrolase family protein [Shouchella shacheensis]|uniref:amidohydrolase family protein n=1 Tax=Shouchella shacheensis TaxID=1649580 RepID=UPI00073FA8C6|nr:amidohydrolase family protein [Shouchella shacheensis]